MRTAKRRRGTAAVELAIVLPILALFLVGAWEVGRLVLVTQLLSNAAREGGRQASTGKKTADQVKADVVEYLQVNGITAVTVNDVTVTNKTSSARPDPTQANQLDQFEVSVRVPFSSVRWIFLDRVTTVDTLGATTEWYSMRDIPIAVNNTIPLN